MAFRRFEDIDAWKTARELVRSIDRVCGLPSFKRDFYLRDQIRRAATSVMSNIAEGFTRRSDREFVHFLFVAKSSAAEVQSHLYVALDRGHIDENQFSSLSNLAQRCERQLSGLISYLLGLKPARKSLDATAPIDPKDQVDLGATGGKLT